MVGNILAHTFHHLMELHLGLFFGSELIDSQTVVTLTAHALLYPYKSFNKRSRLINGIDIEGAVVHAMYLVALDGLVFEQWL